jgi:hypothetical protein
MFRLAIHCPQTGKLVRLKMMMDQKTFLRATFRDIRTHCPPYPLVPREIEDHPPTNQQHEQNHHTDKSILKHDTRSLPGASSSPCGSR